MEQFEKEYRLSLYEPLTELNSSPKSEITLVQHSLNSKIFIKKVLRSFNRDVFEKLKSLECLHLPKIYEIFDCESTLVVIEEFINGQTLEEMMKEQGLFTEDVAITYIMTLCGVLAQLHKHDPAIIHRDLKPSNVMISNDGVLKLIDFDVSRIYKDDRHLDTHVLGTKGYASPEQFGFEQTDARSDIYSLGVMLNVLVTGANPKQKPLQSPLKKVIEKCTCLSPEERYQTVDELKVALKPFIKELPRLDDVHKPEKSLPKRLSHLLSRVVYELGELPGYRLRFFPFMVIATLWYAFLLFGAFHAISISNLAIATMFFLMTLLNGNYKSIHERNRLLANHRVVGLFVYNVVIFVVGGLFL